MPFGSDRERRAAFARLSGLTPPRRPRLSDRLPSGGARGRGQYGPPSDQDIQAVLRLDRPWLDYVLEGQLLTEDALERAGRLVESTPVVLAAYRALWAYYLDRLAVEDLDALNESGPVRRAFEKELRERHIGQLKFIQLRTQLEEALLHHATEGEGGESA